MIRIGYRSALSAAAVGAAAILLSALLPNGTAAQVEYDFILVEAFDESFDLREVYLRDINEAGVACGTSTYESSYAGFVWTGEAGKEIVPITWTRGINNLNQIVGDDRMYDTATGQVTVVPPAGGWPLTRLHGINDNSVVVGFAECSCSNSDHVLQSALIWDADHGSRTTGIPTARELLRINNSNVAVGNIRPSAGSSEAFVYDVDTGAHTNLSDLLSDPPFGRPWSEASDINAGGAVCGQGYDGTTVRGMVWSPAGGFTFLPGLEGGDPTRVFPMGINDDGLVVGRALSGATGDWDAFIWDSVNGMRSLNDLVDAPGTFNTDWGVEISDEGWIVGIGHYGPGWGTARGFVLVPLGIVDTPAPLAFAGGAALRLTPNPATRSVNLEWPAGLVPAGARLTIFDAAGRAVATLDDGDRHHGGAGQLQWAVPAHLAAGVYFVRLGSRSGGVVGRLVLTR